jgi:ATP-dependent RNA helicase RhlE
LIRENSIETGASGAKPRGFSALALADSLREAVAAAGYREPTPIQREAIPHVVAGRDLLGCAQTGTGKTAAFALPILHRLLDEGRSSDRPVIRALILAPTRELAAQIGASFARYGKGSGLRGLVVFGGVSKLPQTQALRRGVDILVATPGRLLDLMNDGAAQLGSVRTFVLDEADRMLDMGFIQDVRRITRALPRERQTLLFSATMPREIQELADRILVDPVRLAVDPVASTCEPIAQSVYFVETRRKVALLQRLLGEAGVDRALVFTRTKRAASRLAQQLAKAGVVADAIHGNKSQPARERALAGFKSGRTRVVVATDIAARGIDVKDISHVINFELPMEAESYVHRVGRTGRAGASGIALSFCSAEERPRLTAIERLTGRILERRELPAGMPAATEPDPMSGTNDRPAQRRSDTGRRASSRSFRASDSARGRSTGRSRSRRTAR